MCPTGNDEYESRCLSRRLFPLLQGFVRGSKKFPHRAPVHSSLHAECNDRPPLRPPHLLHFAQQLRFQILRIHYHLASRNLLIAGPVIAEFAHAQAVLRAHRRSKRAASHRASIVKLAQSCLRIEHRTNLIIGEFREALFKLQTLIQHARMSITWKLRCQSPDRSPCSQANLPSPLRIRLLQFSQPML